MEEKLFWIPSSLQAVTAGRTRPMRQSVCRSNGSKVKKRLDPSPNLDAILECLHGITADHSRSTNNPGKKPNSPVLDHPLVESMFCLLSALPLPSLEEEILQAFRHRHQSPLSPGSLVLMGFIPCWSLKGGGMSSLTQVLEASQDSRKVTHSPVQLGVHPYDQNPRKLESLFVNQATRVTVNEHGEDVHEQFILDSIRRLNNTVKTDLEKYYVYLMGLNSRLRNLDRQAATVTRDLERANIELEALKQKNCALGVLEQESQSQKLTGNLKCHPIRTDFQNQRDGSDLLWYDNLHHLKSQQDIHVRPPKHHRPESPSAQTTKSRGLLNCMLHCQAHIDTLKDQLNQQIMKTEMDIIAGAKLLIQARRDRREKRRKPVPDLRRLSHLPLSPRN